jgi:copper chaperone NosL
MIVSDPRHAAAVVYGDGRIERFDDVGCLVRHLTEVSPAWPPSPETHIWVHGSEDQWLDARQARFLYDPSVATPMGYGWLALEESKAADTLLRFEQLPAAVSASQMASQLASQVASQTTH